MKKKFWLFLFLLILCGVLVLIFIKFDFVKKDDNDTIVNHTYYDNSKSSIVMDVTTKRVLYQNNIHERMLPASTTKILTCITAIEHYQLDDFVVINSDVLKTEGSSIYLEVGDVISIKDLLYGLMLCSGNDAANALALHYSGNLQDFIFLMNETAKKIGMYDSTFENPHGLDTTTKNYTTTYDMALLMSYAMKNETFKTITSTKDYHPTIISGKKMYYHNKHRLIQSDEKVTGGKTGYTKNAKRTLVTSFKQEDFEIVVVTFNCSDDWNVHEGLANYCFDKYKQKRILSKFDVLFYASFDQSYLIENEKLLVPIRESETINYKIYEDDEGIRIVYFINKEEVGDVIFRSIKDE